MKKRNIFSGILALLTAGVLLMGSTLSVSAVILPFTNEVMAEDDGDHSINISTVSSYQILIGETFVLQARSDGLDPKKCEYAYYVRYNGTKWHTIGVYSPNDTAAFTPKQTGSYEFCIKIRCNKKVYKRYYTCTVTRPIVNRSLISTSFLQRGSAVVLSGKAAGGEGDFQFTYLMKRAEEAEWTALCEQSSTAVLQWTPRESGDYDICIRATDKIGSFQDKSFRLTVSSDGRRYPSEFTLTVEAPIASPYLWSCEVSDESLLEWEQISRSCGDDMLHPAVLLQYRFTPRSAGTVDIRMSYRDCQGKSSELTYRLLIDNSLNYQLLSEEGSYFETELPKPREITGAFTLNLQKSGDGHTWVCEIDNSQVLEFRQTISGWQEDIYVFRTLRRGHATLTFTCTSPDDPEASCKLIYTILVDDNRIPSVHSADGYYFRDELPQLHGDAPNEQEESFEAQPDA